MVIVLESRVNELRELTASIPEYQELSQNLSLESVMNHLRSRDQGVPEVIEKFSLRTMALENDGLIFAGVIAIIAAITALIMRFTNWLGGGSSSSSSGGGSSGSRSTFTVRMSTGETPDEYLARMRARHARETAYRQAMHDYNEALRRARDAAFDSKMESLREKMRKDPNAYANKSTGSNSSHQSPPKKGTPVSSIQDILNIWVKDPDNKDTPLARFLKNSEPMYQEISERGEYYQMMVAQEKLSPIISKAISAWPGRLHIATTIIKQMAQGGMTDEVLQGLEDKMLALRSSSIMVDVPHQGTVLLEQYCNILDEKFGYASARSGNSNIHFEKLHEHFFSAEVVSLAAAMLKELNDSAAGMKETQERLEELQNALKAMPEHAGPGALAHKTIVQDTTGILDSARRDIMAYVRCTHHTKRFTEVVRRMDAEMTRANTAVINILKKVEIPDSEDKTALNAARKKFEESMTIDV